MIPEPTMLDAKKTSLPTPPEALPRARGIPLLGSAPELLRDPLRFLRREHARLGPIFEVRAPRRRLVVLAGKEANRFFAEEGRECLSAERFWGRLARHEGCPHLMLALEGSDHRRLRRLFSQDLSPRLIQRHAEGVGALVEDALFDARAEGEVSIQRFCRVLVSRQAHHLLTRGDDPVDMETLRALMENFRYLSNTLLLSKWPAIVLRTPRHRSQAETVARFAERVRRATEGATEGWFASVRKGEQTLPHLFTEGDVRTYMTLPFILGIDTVGSTLAFLIREILKDPTLRARLVAAVDAAFEAHEGELPPVSALRAVDELRAAIAETMRLHPAAFGVYRNAARAFHFAGHRIPEGADVLMFTTGAHTDPAVFSEPYRFDIDRHLPPRNEPSDRHALAPYGGGSHLCLGMGMGESMLALTAAVILRTAELEVVDTGPRRPHTFDPSLALDPRCTMRVTGHRSGWGSSPRS